MRLWCQTCWDLFFFKRKWRRLPPAGSHPAGRSRLWRWEPRGLTHSLLPSAPIWVAPSLPKTSGCVLRRRCSVSWVLSWGLINSCLSLFSFSPQLCLMVVSPNFWYIYIFLMKFSNCENVFAIWPTQERCFLCLSLSPRGRVSVGVGSRRAFRDHGTCLIEMVTEGSVLAAVHTVACYVQQVKTCFVFPCTTSF